MDWFAQGQEGYDEPREAFKARKKELNHQIDVSEHTSELKAVTRKSFGLAYQAVAVVSCILLIGVLLYTVANLPYFGRENPRAVEVVQRYVEEGLKETGAVNIVSGMILDYRAFDTLGESHVLFTALICVLVLLRKDKKNMQSLYEDYYSITLDHYYDISGDSILHRVGMILIPSILLFGIYVILNGQNSPGGGFSGGAVMGAGLIMTAAAYGFDHVDRFFTLRFFERTTFIALTFYSFAKGYVFFMGANGLESHIPKGTPGAVLSGGLILPLDIAVGFVVMCTMFGFYSLFRRGSIGGD
ncbi:MAG: hypothetical protein IKE58_05660 [Blautia sp.]|nr:hypothetical protein [Blautia sp.]